MLQRATDEYELKYWKSMAITYFPVQSGLIQVLVENESSREILLGGKDALLLNYEAEMSWSTRSQLCFSKGCSTEYR